MTGGMIARAAVGNAAMRRVPVTACCMEARSASAAAIAPVIASAWRTNRWAASVSRTRRPLFSSSWTPASRSRMASCCETADGVTCIASAAALIEPRREISRSS